jgi:hypothetical protein
MNKATLNNRSLTAWAGIIGPALFVTVFLVEGWIRPGYNPLAEFVSALSLGPRGWIQIANFIIFGLLLFAFSRVVAAEFPSGKASRWGVILLMVLGVCYFVSGPAVMDPTTGTLNSLAGATFHGILHGIMGGIVFLIMPIVIFVFLRRFRSDPEWQFLKGWSWVLGIICAVDDIFFTAVSKSPDLSAAFSSWMGLIQRSVIIPFMIWIFVFALGLYRRSQEE